MNIKEINIDNINETDALSQKLAKILSLQKQQQIIFLQGDLGTGKTTLTQHLLKHLGIHDRVKSPSYTLIELYETKNQKIYHIDLYRLQDPNEIENLGLHDMLKEDAIFIIEWPEKLKTFNIHPHLSIDLELFQNGQRKVKLKSNNKFWKEHLIYPSDFKTLEF